MTSRVFEWRAVTTFVVLDVLTYALVYWLVLPAFAPVIAALPAVTADALGHVITAIRLGFVAAVVVRGFRSRHGFDVRSEVVPVVLVGALTGWLLHVVAGVAVGLAAGLTPWTWGILVALVEWVVFAMVGALFVAPGPADDVPLRFRQMARSDRGGVSLFLLPAVAGLVFATLLVVVVLGSATNDRREAATAADAAALAAAQEWRDGLEDAHRLAEAATTEDGFWSSAGRRLADLTPRASMEAAAGGFAARNDAELVGMSVDVWRGEVTVRVRHLDQVPEGSTRMTSEATAALRFRSGLCRSGDRIGLLVGSTCRTAPPPSPPPTPTPTPPDDEELPEPPPPPPWEAPSAFGSFHMDVVLQYR